MAIEKINNDGVSDILERIIQHKGQDFITHNEMFLAKVNKIIEETVTIIVNGNQGNEINKKNNTQ